MDHNFQLVLATSNQPLGPSILNNLYSLFSLLNLLFSFSETSKTSTSRWPSPRFTRATYTTPGATLLSRLISSPRLVFTELSSHLVLPLVSEELGMTTLLSVLTMSVGVNEAVELRDGDKSKWGGKGKRSYKMRRFTRAQPDALIRCPQGCCQCQRRDCARPHEGEHRCQGPGQD